MLENRVGVSLRKCHFVDKKSPIFIILVRNSEFEYFIIAPYTVYDIISWKINRKPVLKSSPACLGEGTGEEYAWSAVLAKVETKP